MNLETLSLNKNSVPLIPLKNLTISHITKDLLFQQNSLGHSLFFPQIIRMKSESIQKKLFTVNIAESPTPWTYSYLFCNPESSKWFSTVVLKLLASGPDEQYLICPQAGSNQGSQTGTRGGHSGTPAWPYRGKGALPSSSLDPWGLGVVWSWTSHKRRVYCPTPIQQGGRVEAERGCGPAPVQPQRGKGTWTSPSPSSWGGGTWCSPNLRNRIWDLGIRQQGRVALLIAITPLPPNYPVHGPETRSASCIWPVGQRSCTAGLVHVTLTTAKRMLFRCNFHRITCSTIRKSLKIIKSPKVGSV